MSVSSIAAAIGEMTFSRIDPDAPLDEIGLDSNDLVDLEAELRKRSGIPSLRIFEMLEHKTLRELILRLQTQQRERERAAMR
jgi:aryl carrier-like protein